MNINTMKAENYKWIKDNLLRPDDAVRSLTYVEQLAMYTNTDISTWDMLKKLKLDNEMALVTAKRTINRRFFLGELEEDPQDMSEQDIWFLERSEELVRGRCLRDTLRRIEDLSYEITTLRRNLEAKEAMRNLLRHESMRAYKPEKPFHEQVKAIIGGNWVITKLDVGRISVKTKNNIFVAYKNEVQGVDVNLDLGRFEFTIDMWRGAVFPNSSSDRAVQRRGGTLVDKVFIHPHVRTDSICWGEEKEAMLGAMAKGDLETILERLFAVLTQYNHDDPYIDISHFHRQQVIDGKLANVRDEDGYDIFGYGEDGFTRNGWDADGYDREGYNRDGYNRDDIHRDGDEICNNCEENLDDCGCEPEE